MVSNTLRTINLENPVWSLIPSTESNALFVETRDESKEKVEVSVLNLEDLKATIISANLQWWHKLVGTMNDDLYCLEYRDQNDPNKQSFFSINQSSGKRQELDYIPDLMAETEHPSIYEHGSDYHHTVQEFLAIDLPLSCEYMEWADKIIISYYLRSDKAFDRYLLILSNGKKELKIRQDHLMKGFAPGSFFVFNNQLIFIKDRNEICIYTG